ncbi:hypothetical protein KC842_02845 [Candidatus Nomurabacteria bacterium]|nr:hypothetical protein [Candidatus Nomurabacteria bacterium]
MDSKTKKISLVIFILVLIILGLIISRSFKRFTVDPLYEKTLSSNLPEIEDILDNLYEQDDVVIPSTPTNNNGVNIVFLKSLLSQYEGDTEEIRECSVNGQTMYVYTDAGSGYDGGYHFYSSSGVQIESCGGFSPQGPSSTSLCTTALPSCTLIYGGGTFTGNYDPQTGLPILSEGVDVYGLDNSDEVSSTQNSCVITGCTNQICANAGENVATICDASPVYQCYQDAVCEVQESGECGWTETEELNSCIEEYS